MKKTAKTQTITTPTKTSELREVRHGAYTIIGYKPPQHKTPADVRKIVKNLLAPIQVPAKKSA